MTQPIEDEDEELVHRFREHDDYEAFEALMLKYQDKAYRLAWGLVKEYGLAQDVVQDAFLNVYRKIDTFKGDSAFSSWVYRIVVNAGLMKLRKKRRRPEVSFDELNEYGPHFLENGHHAVEVPRWRVRADEAAENKELREKIIEAIDDLEPIYQTAFVLREMEGMSLQEIADLLDLTVPAVKSRLHRARLYLRATLERYLS